MLTNENEQKIEIPYMPDELTAWVAMDFPRESANSKIYKAMSLAYTINQGLRNVIDNGAERPCLDEFSVVLEMQMALLNEYMSQSEEVLRRIPATAICWPKSLRQSLVWLGGALRLRCAGKC
jgi:hypothetical protein